MFELKLSGTHTKSFSLLFTFRLNCFKPTLHPQLMFALQSLANEFQLCLTIFKLDVVFHVIPDF